MTRKKTPTQTKNLNTPSRLSDSTDKQTPKRCNCESDICAAACAHPLHACHKLNLKHVTAFGIRQTLCQDCAYFAARRYGSDVIIHASGLDVDGTPDEINTAIDRMNRNDAALESPCAGCGNTPQTCTCSAEDARYPICPECQANLETPADLLTCPDCGLRFAAHSEPTSAAPILSEQQYKDTLAAQNDRERRNNEETQRQALDRVRCAECTEQTKAAAVQESKTWTAPHRPAMTADMKYGADLAEVLAQLLDTLSLEPGNKSDYLRNAMTNANNTLHEYQLALDEDDAAAKAAMV